MRHHILAFLIAQLAAAAALSACSNAGVQTAKAMSPEYDAQTGRLKLLKYDSDGDGVIDTWSYMDGGRVLRIEVDTDEDGTVDRWEHYGATGKLEKIGFSSEDDGREDAWQYLADDGTLVRLEISGTHDGKVTRV